MATITQADDGTNVKGWYRSVTKTITPGTGVVAGGEAISAADLGLASIVEFPSFTLRNGGTGDATAIRWAVYNVSTGKLAYFSAAGTEVTGDLSAFQGRVTILGKG